MKMNPWKISPITKVINSVVVDLPAPPSITAFWNFGSLLGLCLMVQILTGIFLAFHYINTTALAFESVVNICRDVNYGWALRSLHANGASLFFICIFLHIGRGIYFNSYRNVQAWIYGVVVLFLLMATAFLGYVLPWGQMSFWGATVITNLLSTIPYLGMTIVEWLWGGFSLGTQTLTRFFTLHFLLPFVTIMMIFMHILALHEKGSSNPLGLKAEQEKIPFHPYFSLKDAVGFLMLLLVSTMIIFFNPNILGDPENFIEANSLSTPPHIQPEWYYLFAYAILRAVTNKLGGVVALVLSILILLILPVSRKPKFQSMFMYPINQMMFWSFISIFFLLTWIGARPVEAPYTLVNQALATLYFLYFLLDPLMMKKWDSLTS